MSSRPLSTPLAISPGELAAILRADLTSFIERSFYELHPHARLDLAPHIEVIATKLEEVRRGKVRRLIINLPPRHLKSHCVSVAFVAWLLGHDPATHVICASYGQELAQISRPSADGSCAAASTNPCLAPFSGAGRASTIWRQLAADGASPPPSVAF